MQKLVFAREGIIKGGIKLRKKKESDLLSFVFLIDNIVYVKRNR